MTPSDETRPPVAEGRARAAVSVAILAALAGVPIVVAAGFLADRSAPVPRDISALALRGVFDAGPTVRPPGGGTTAQAGY